MLQTHCHVADPAIVPFNCTTTVNRTTTDLHASFSYSCVPATTTSHSLTFSITTMRDSSAQICVLMVKIHHCVFRPPIAMVVLRRTLHSQFPCL
ncbi:DNA/RNA helicase, superfamily II [Sesbania bispinosa]|nr:DNA/RNA helicase, superfamily II [Sesbania bispinosa]